MPPKTVPITCPKCGKSQSERTRGLDPDKRPVVCGNCGHILTSEEVKACLIKPIRNIVEEMKAALRPKK